MIMRIIWYTCSMVFLFNSFMSFFNSTELLFVVSCLSCIAKMVLALFLGYRGWRLPKISKPLIFLLGVLLSALLTDVAWVVKLFRLLIMPEMDYRYVLFIIRIAWVSNIIQYQLLGLFIESLGEQAYKVRLHQKILLSISSVLVSYFLYVAIFHFDVTTVAGRAFELKVMYCTSIPLIILLPSLYLTFVGMRSSNFPKILQRQLVILIKYLIIPYALSEFIQGVFLSQLDFSFAVTNLSTTLLFCALFYSTRKVIGLRFLNFQSHVQADKVYNFIDDFKVVLERFSRATNIKELGHISQLFFKEAFGILPSRITLYFRSLTMHNTDIVQIPTAVESVVEMFNSVCTENQDVAQFIQEHKILIYDEIAFSNFYDEDTHRSDLLLFLDKLNADIFLPIYQGTTLMAYIIIERNARYDNFYSKLERDEMVVFASYLGNIINLLQNRNINGLLKREKEMSEELYRKHQEINQYKESIRSFLRDNKQRKIGIIFYKNRKFIFGNKAAKELISINLNQEEGHPLTKAFKSIVRQVEDYKASQDCFIKDHNGHTMVVSGLPNLEHNNIILTIYYPEVADIIKKQIELLKNPSEWDYLLYLETTKSGQLINQLIPGTGEHLLNFKIELLKTALSKKALLLEMPEDDLVPMVEIIHHISLRETLHMCKLKSVITSNDMAIKLFGINPLFGDQKVQPLLEKLHNVGTLFIENIHFLDLQTQNYLAEFIKYDSFYIFKSDQKVYSNVRIICSTNQNLQTLVQEGKFSKELFNELKSTTLAMPSLSSLPTQELETLVDGFTEQAVQQKELTNLLELSTKDKHKLLYDRPISLHEFKIKIQNMLVHKSKKNNIYKETEFDPAYNVSDPELMEAARLGKKALRDPKIMALLWNKFKNQNQIATFLGVNRSSVNRRCKDFNLTV